MIISTLVILLPMVFGLIVWNELPEMMPTHFGFDGEVNDTASKAFAVIGLPVMILAIHLLCIFVTKKDPKNSAIGDKVFNLIFYICPACSIFGGVLMYASVYELNISYGLFGSSFMGLIFIIVGNYLPKCRQNYTVGIKIPWTLASEANWNATHRFAGWVWVVTGIMIIFCGLFKKWALMITAVFISVFITFIYSYLYYEKYDKYDKGETK